MAIESPRIVAGPTVQRRYALSQPITVDDGLTAPQYEGQVYFSYNLITTTGGASRFYEMYVAVDISGTLTWVKVDVSTYQDRYTGEAVDPMTFGSNIPGGG
jgi:hypothetical protein